MNDEFDASYAPGSNGEVIFLMLGGESEANPEMLNDPNWAHMQYAQTYGATVYLLEHRYYGKSRPTA